MRILQLFLILLLSNFGWSQNPYYTVIDNTSGLPNNSVYDIFQDSKGFMWFATGKGLCKYDGNNIKTYTADFQTSKSGSCIQEDKYGRIWYENFDGFLYYVENEELKSISQNKTLGYFRYGITKNNLMVLENDGLMLYDLKTLKPLKKIKKTFNHLTFSYSFENVFYVFDDKLYEINELGVIKAHEFPENFSVEFNSAIVQKIEDGIIIISKFNNNYCYFRNGKFEKKQFDFKTEFIQNLATTKDNVWLCTTKGLIQFNTKDTTEKKYFHDKNISFVYLDKEKNYWISTINEGVYFIENFNTKIIEIPSKPVTLSKTSTDLLVGVENDAVYSINPNNYSFKSIYKGKLNHGVNQLFYDTETNTTYLTSTSFKFITNNKTQELAFGAIKSIEKIDDKYFAFAASNLSGFFTTKPKLKSSWDPLLNDYLSSNVNSYKIVNLIPNANGKSTTYNPINETIYFATNNGLIAFSKKEKKEVKYKNETLYFTKIYYYNGTVYGFSSNEKLYCISSTNQITLFKYPKELAKSKIERISLENQFLFAYATNAIYEINLDTKNYKKIITLTDEISVSDITILNNCYYFASSKGIIVKNKTENKSHLTPKLFINKTVVNDDKLITENNAELNYTENNIKINFTVLSYIPNEKFKVVYSINDSKWNQLDAENRNLILSSLAPDNYLIKLKIDDKNCKDYETIRFTINKPLWLNPILLSVLGILVLLLFYTFYKWQIAKIQKKNRIALEKINLEKNVNQSKLKAIKSQMNPHFFYNALNTLQSYILSNEKKQAIDYLSKFSNLTRTILEITEKDFISITDEIKTLKLYLDIEKARFEDDFNYEINTNSEAENGDIEIPTMLLQPYIENAIKHGLLHKSGKKELKITFDKNQDILKITIDDNGIGREKSGKLNAIKNRNHNSFATKAMQNRIDLLNQYNHKNILVAIIDKTNPLGQSLGTTVIFDIPIVD